MQLLLFVVGYSFAQKADSTKILQQEKIAVAPDNSTKSTSTTKAIHNPKIATKRSLMIPGWGQAYNKEYWKIPIVYGALSIPTITFIYNNNVYKEARFAYDARIKATIGGGQDSTDYKSLDSKYQRADINSIQTLRNAARRDRDYSVLWFLVVWGLNVADATVFGHLKDFDVSNNLSMNVKPEFNTSTRTPGLSFTFKLRDKKNKPVFAVR
ncbi:MAG: DUF5683 domain-containing protein [Chitinophagaceae bacterium]